MPGAISVQSLTEAAPPGEAYTLHYGNRPIVEFRARLLGRSPQERARGTVRRLDELVALRLHAPVESKVVGGVAVVAVAGRDAVMVLPADLDASAGETLEAAGRAAAAKLALALSEVSEARSPRLLLLDALRALGGTLVALLLGGLLWWLRDRVARRMTAWVDARLVRNLVRDARSDVRRTVEATLVAALRFLSRVILLGLSVVLLYAWVSFRLRQFPYTRPWGEALRTFVVATLVDLGRGALSALPGLFSVALIVVITRVVVRLTNALFRSVEQGRLSMPGVYAETAQPTRRLAAAILWLFAGHGRLSLPARQRQRRVQGRQRVRRPDAVARLERPREPGHEQLHDHLLARAAARRLRADRRGRGHGACTPACWRRRS